MPEKKATPKEQFLELDFNNVMADVVGADSGLTRDEINEHKNNISDAHNDLMARRKNGELPFYDLPFLTKDLRKLRRAADEIRKRVDNFVVLGIGGSALGTKAVFRALRPLNQNLFDPRQKTLPPPICRRQYRSGRHSRPAQYGRSPAYRVQRGQ